MMMMSKQNIDSGEGDSVRSIGINWPSFHGSDDSDVQRIFILADGEKC